MDSAQQTLTSALLARLAAGDERAASELFPLLYGELRGIARSAMEDDGAPTLQPTALVHEAWMRLASAGVAQEYASRAHFLGVASKAMRSVLVDHARKRAALKRGGDRERLLLEDVVELFEQSAPDLIGLDAALEKLAKVDGQLARIVELRFFGGCSVEDTASALRVSEPTVVRGWRVARMWLRRELGAA
jgi:RNA polymerase sigma-70 factor (ECF subfamily)